MKKKAMKFIAVFLCVCILLAGALSAFAYFYDPQNVYRWNGTRLQYYSPTYSAAGIIKHYDYDTVLIGSSMVQNFDADLIARELDCKPVKLTIGGMSAAEQLFIYDEVQKRSCAVNYIVNIDLHRIALQEKLVPDAARFPEHMFFPNTVSQFKYLLGYETWFRFIPIDIALNLCAHLNIDFSPETRKTIDDATAVNEMCRWNRGELPGAQRVLSDFLSGAAGFEDGSESDPIINPDENIEIYIAHLLKSLDNGEILTLVLPPYSVLSWAEYSADKVELMLSMRRRIATLADEHDNVRVLDFQSMPHTTDLNNYYDKRHFSQELQDEIALQLASERYAVDEEKITVNSQIIRNNLAEFSFE